MGEWLILILLTIHLLAAMAWVGGLIFFMFVAIPVTRRHPELGLAALFGRGFRPVAWSALGTLLVSGIGLLAVDGLTGAVLTSKVFWRTAFGTTLALKLLLVLVVVVLSAWHDIRLGPRAEQHGATGAVRWVGRVVGLLSLAIVIAGVALANGR